MELITVSKRDTANGSVNTVDAHSLHAKLEIKTPFSMWIQRAIEKYGFIEEEDFLTFLLQSQGGRPSKRYWVTLDMAKELCMLDESLKGKGFRKYFIECEKQTYRPLTQLEQLQLIAQSQIDVIQKVEKNTNDIEQLKNDITLTSAQKRHLQNAVAQKVYSWQPKEEQTKKLFAKVYKRLKDTFVVSSYMDIKRVDFNNAISLINALELVDLV